MCWKGRLGSDRKELDAKAKETGWIHPTEASVILMSTNNSSAMHGKVDKNGEGSSESETFTEEVAGLGAISHPWFKPWPLGRGEGTACVRLRDPTLVRSPTELTLKAHVSFVSSGLDTSKHAHSWPRKTGVPLRPAAH